MSFSFKKINLISGARLPNPNDVVAYDELERIFANVSIAKEWVKKKNSINLERFNKTLAIDIKKETITFPLVQESFLA